MERIKRKAAASGKGPTQQHYPMQSVQNDMDSNEIEALQSGTRKRRAPVKDGIGGGAKNV